MAQPFWLQFIDISDSVDASSATLLEKDNNRQFFMFQNISSSGSDKIGVNFTGGTAALDTPGTITLAGGDPPIIFDTVVPLNKITIIGSGSDIPFTALYAKNSI